MDSYTCSCGNQTWYVLEQEILCTKCSERFPLSLLTPVDEFNQMVLDKVAEEQEV